MKKINIIGAGVSGLCAGAYLQMNGFETEIFEKHDVPGGLCTSWQNGEFTIDGSVHWILGSDKGSGFYNMWTELLDLSIIPFYNHEERLCLTVLNNQNKYGSKDFIVYTNLQRFQNYLIDLAPEDENHIKRIIQDIRDIQDFELPPLMDPLPLIPSILRGIKMIRYLRFLFILFKQKNRNNITVAEKFNNPFLKEAFQLLFDNYKVNMLVFNFPMACFDKKSGGYPIGGSLSWAKRLEERYLQLGGKIQYRTPVKRIVTEHNRTTGIIVRNDVFHPSDIVLSCADWHNTIFNYLNGEFVNDQILKIQREEVVGLYYSVLLITFGLSHDYKEFHHFNRFPIDKKMVSPCGTEYERLETHFYHYDPTLAPKGKTVMACSFYTKNGNYWIELRKTDRKKYREEKQRFLELVKDALEIKYPGFKANIEMEDFSTPATIVRYTNNWQGSAQGWLPDNTKIFNPTPISFTLPKLKNMYCASHWNRPGGGIPVAINMARDVTKLICKHQGISFSTQKVKQTKA